MTPVPTWLTDVQLLALTIWGEGRGEPVEGRIAIACAIRNRVNADLGNDGKPDWWGEGYRGVCLARWQFSCWNENDPNRAKLDALIVEILHGDPFTMDPVLNECRWVADGVHAGLVMPRVGPATHYHSASMSPYPAWTATATLVGRVGSHLFYAGVA